MTKVPGDEGSAPIGRGSVAGGAKEICTDFVAGLALSCSIHRIAVYLVHEPDISAAWRQQVLRSSTLVLALIAARLLILWPLALTLVSLASHSVLHEAARAVVNALSLFWTPLPLVALFYAITSPTLCRISERSVRLAYRLEGRGEAKGVSRSPKKARVQAVYAVSTALVAATTLLALRLASLVPVLGTASALALTPWMLACASFYPAWHVSISCKTLRQRLPAADSLEAAECMWPIWAGIGTPMATILYATRHLVAAYVWNDVAPSVAAFATSCLLPAATILSVDAQQQLPAAASRPYTRVYVFLPCSRVAYGGVKFVSWLWRHL